MNPNTDITQRIEPSTPKMPFIGYMTVWELSGLKVPALALEASLTAIGKRDMLPKPPTKAVVLNRAVSAWIRSRVKAGALPGISQRDDEDEDVLGTGLKTRSMLRKINGKKSSWLVYQLVFEKVDLNALGLSYLTDLRICLHKHLDILKVTSITTGEPGDGANDGATLAQETAELKLFWKDYDGVYTANDLGRLVRQLLDRCEARSLREGGGAYFVPVGSYSDLAIVKDLIEGKWNASGASASKSYLIASPIPDTASIKASMARATHEDFMRELAELETDLAVYAEKARSGSNDVRKATMLTKMSRYKELANKAAIYNEMLGMRMDTVERRVNGLTKLAREVIELSLDGLADEEDAASQPLEGQQDPAASGQGNLYSGAA